MHVDWGMTFIQVHMGPEINHTCPNLSITVKRDFGGSKGGETQGVVCVCGGGEGVGRVVMTRGRMEGGTYRPWSTALCLVHEAVWSSPKRGSKLTPVLHTL